MGRPRKWNNEAERRRDYRANRARKRELELLTIADVDEAVGAAVRFYASFREPELKPHEWTAEELALETGMDVEWCRARMERREDDLGLYAGATPPAPTSQGSGLLTSRERDAIIVSGSGVGGWPRDLSLGV